MLLSFIVKANSELSVQPGDMRQTREPSSSRPSAADDPVAVIEAMEVVRVEAIAEVGPHAYRPRARGRGQPPRDRGQAVGVAPGLLDPALQLLDTHPRGRKDHVLPI